MGRLEPIDRVRASDRNQRNVSFHHGLGEGRLTTPNPDGAEVIRAEAAFLLRSGPPLSARCPELFPVLAHDHSRRSNPNADAAPLIDECTFSRDPPHDILGCQYERHPLTTFTPTPASCRDSVRRVANLLRNYGGMPGGRREVC
jgi:hypothetical protein